MLTFSLNWYMARWNMSSRRVDIAVCVDVQSKSISPHNRTHAMYLYVITFSVVTMFLARVVKMSRSTNLKVFLGSSTFNLLVGSWPHFMKTIVVLEKENDRRPLCRAVRIKPRKVSWPLTGIGPMAFGLALRRIDHLHSYCLG